MSAAVTLYHHDLPHDLRFPEGIAIDTETMGLNPCRDRLCLVQLSGGDGEAHLVQIAKERQPAPNLCRLLEDQSITKIFHFARFDIAALNAAFGVVCQPVFCTKVASRLVRTYTDKHGLKELCKELLGVDLSKAQQSSDWGASDLTAEQQQYAASDVLHLHALKRILEERLAREERMNLAESCFQFLPCRARLDLAGWPDTDIFAHN
jgi:ribonuclease D